MGSRLAALPVEAISPLLNLGSSTAEYRSTICPFINREIFDPLSERGVEIIHVDMKAADGVDVVGDITDPSVQALIRTRKPRSLICTSLLEHVRERQVICASIETILEDEGYLFLSVPHRYPYHPDPIDTGYRPTPEQLASEFPKLYPIEHQLVEFGNYTGQIVNKPWLIIRDVYLLFAGFKRSEKWKVFFSNYSFLIRKYSSACLVLKKSTTR